MKIFFFTIRNALIIATYHIHMVLICPSLNPGHLILIGVTCPYDPKKKPMKIELDHTGLPKQSAKKPLLRVVFC